MRSPTKYWPIPGAVASACTWPAVIRGSTSVIVPKAGPLSPRSRPSSRTVSPACRCSACRSGTSRRSTKCCSAIVATVSPGSTTVPSVTGTVSTRPAIGDRTLRDAGIQGAGRHLHRGAGAVELLARDRAAARQGLGAGEIDLGLRELRAQADDLGVKRFNLQLQLLISYRGDDLAGIHVIAVLDREPGDGAADASARGNDVAAFDRRKHRLLVRHHPRRDRIGRRRPGGGGHQQQGKEQGNTAHETAAPLAQPPEPACAHAGGG